MLSSADLAGTASETAPQHNGALHPGNVAQPGRLSVLLAFAMPLTPACAVAMGLITESPALVWLAYASALYLMGWILPKADAVAWEKVAGPSVVQTVTDLVPRANVITLIVSLALVAMWVFYRGDGTLPLVLFVAMFTLALGLVVPDWRGDEFGSVGGRFLTGLLEVLPMLAAVAAPMLVVAVFLVLPALDSAYLKVWLLLGAAFAISNLLHYTHVLVHQSGPWARLLSRLMSAACGHPWYTEAHLMVHANRRVDGVHWVAARSDESFYRYASTRFVQSWRDALDWIRMRHGTRKSVAGWGLLFAAHGLTLAMAAAALALAGPWGLAFYATLALFSHWLVLGQQFLRHWGLGFQDSIGGESTWVWELPSHWAGMVGLERSGGGMHYRQVTTPYYALSRLRPAPCHRWVGLVMRLVILVPPLYRRVTLVRLRSWRLTNGNRGGTKRRGMAVTAMGERRAKKRVSR